jgi:hypothetical protein
MHIYKNKMLLCNLQLQQTQLWLHIKMDRKIYMALKVTDIIFTNSRQKECACETPEIAHRTPGFQRTRFEYHRPTTTHFFIC